MLSPGDDIQDDAEEKTVEVSLFRNRIWNVDQLNRLRCSQSAVSSLWYSAAYIVTQLFTVTFGIRIDWRHTRGARPIENFKSILNIIPFCFVAKKTVFRYSFSSHFFLAECTSQSVACTIVRSSCAHAYRKRTCRFNLGGHCATEEAVNMANQWHYFNSHFSPGRRRRNVPRSVGSPLETSRELRQATRE